MIVVQMIDPNCFSSNCSGRTGHAMNRSDGCARNLQRNPSRLGQRPAGDNQSSPGRYVDGGGKLQGILAVLTASTEKNRDSKLQSRPLPLILPGDAMIQRFSLSQKGIETVLNPHLNSQTSWQVLRPRDHRKPRDQYGNYLSDIPLAAHVNDL
jgi:hypothetical protein